MAVATARKSHAGVAAHSCRRSQPMLGFCGAKSLAREAKSTAAGCSFEPIWRSAAAVAREFASPRALRTAAAAMLQLWYSSADVCEPVRGAAMADPLIAKTAAKYIAASAIAL